MIVEATFAAIEEEFQARVRQGVICNLATVDARGWPRSRVLHVLWEGPIGWVASGRTGLKARQIARQPHVSLAYFADPFKPVYIDCVADWQDDPAEKRRLWELFGATPPPLGYDLAQYFGTMENPEYGQLRLTPWRIELGDLMGEPRVWRA